MPEFVSLPPARQAAGLSVEEAMLRRRTSRQFLTTPLTLEELSRLLWAAQGITGDDGQRTTPSAVMCYPLRVRAAIGNVSRLPPGLYAYDPQRHALTCEAEDDCRAALAKAAIGDQPWVLDAAVVIAVTADIPGMNAHFADQAPHGQRGSRYAYIETGALSENVHLEATALDLGLVLVGGFDDAAANAALQLPAHEETTVLLCLGRV